MRVYFTGSCALREAKSQTSTFRQREPAPTRAAYLKLSIPVGTPRGTIPTQTSYLTGFYAILTAASKLSMLLGPGTVPIRAPSPVSLTRRRRSSDSISTLTERFMDSCEHRRNLESNLAWTDQSVASRTGDLSM